MYSNILVPTDGSQPARAAATHALDLAETYDATIHALYVIDTGTNWLTVSKTEVRDTLRDIGSGEAEQVLQTFTETAGGYDVEVKTAIKDGAPDNEILQYIKDNDIDLIVMGTHGRDGVRRRLLGSITDRVVREAAVPVMTVTPENTER